jgi:hypothetical protein
LSKISQEGTLPRKNDNFTNTQKKKLTEMNFQNDNDLIETIRKDDPFKRQKASKMDKDISEDHQGKEIGHLFLSGLESSRRLKKTSFNLNKWLQVGPTAIADGETVSRLYYYDGLISVDEVKTAIVSGRVTSIVIDPFDRDSKTIYLGTALGGIWKTKDGGRNWFATSDYTDSLAIGSIVMHPKKRNILYAGTGEGNFSGDSYHGFGILKTCDGGQIWKSVGKEQKGLFLNSRFCRIIFHPRIHTTLFAAVTSSKNNPETGSGIYKSVDEGLTWKRLDNNLPGIFNNCGATDIVIDPSNPNTAYVGFYRDFVYKTTDLNSDQPSWKKINLDNFEPSRICLSISPSNSRIVYVLASSNNNQKQIINQFYRSNDGGDTWEKIKIPANKNSSPWEDESLGGQGDYNMCMTVDPKSPDIVYIGGISLWKVIFSKNTQNWIFRDIGKYIHADNHVIAIDPKNNFILYAGNDGGIYRSVDGGETWDDSINEGLCITQFTYMSSHPKTDSMFFAGTQDNGTIQFRNSSLFLTSDHGDGGFVFIDPKEPNNVLHQYIGNRLYHSRDAGRRNSWIDIRVPESGSNSNFYSPFAIDKENSKNVVFGSDSKIFFDKNHGLDGWKESVDLLGFNTGFITALNYVNSGLIYVGTHLGKIFRLTKSGDRWNNPERIEFLEPLPTNWIREIVNYPCKNDTILVGTSGYFLDFSKSSHFWRCKISSSGKGSAEDLTPRTENGEVLNTPVFSIVIDKEQCSNIYIGTEFGVFRTTDDCKSWESFNDGLPNSAVFDMDICYKPKKLLRVVTHGRGAWERRLEDKYPNDIDIFVRDHLMDTGRYTPSYNSNEENRAVFEDPFQHEDISASILLGSKLSWHMSPDIKVDAPRELYPHYQMNPDDVDYVKFESKLYHRNIKKCRTNRIYVQIHNRGTKNACISKKDKIRVKLLYANYDTNNDKHYPDLPNDFWSRFPRDSRDTRFWKSIGSFKVLPQKPKTMSNIEPTVIEWNWNVPPDIGSALWLLLIVDSTEDPIPSEPSKLLFDLKDLAINEKHIAVRLVRVDSDYYF